MKLLSLTLMLGALLIFTPKASASYYVMVEEDGKYKIVPTHYDPNVSEDDKKEIIKKIENMIKQNPDIAKNVLGSSQKVVELAQRDNEFVVASTGSMKGMKERKSFNRNIGNLSVGFGLLESNFNNQKGTARQPIVHLGVSPLDRLWFEASFGSSKLKSERYGREGSMKSAVLKLKYDWRVTWNTSVMPYAGLMTKNYKSSDGKQTKDNVVGGVELQREFAHKLFGKANLGNDSLGLAFGFAY